MILSNRTDNIIHSIFKQIADEIIQLKKRQLGICLVSVWTLYKRWKMDQDTNPGFIKLDAEQFIVAHKFSLILPLFIADQMLNK
ncbi:MAG TPA: hypothetical protein DEO65_16890 [Bacillus bacterium]|nr:hypothetical protein [Bacillus sp. (in: firmicutes)]